MARTYLKVVGVMTHSQLVQDLFSFFFQVKEEMLLEALTTRKTVTVGERLIVPYKLAEVTLFKSDTLNHCSLHSAL